MNKFLTLLLAVGLGAALTGCANTLNGAKEDADKNAQTATAAAQQAGNAVKAVPGDIDAATVISPLVKTAILRDPVLDDKRNLINVNSHGRTVTLVGHVTQADMIQRATEDAQAALKKHPDFQVDNQLTVAAGS
jgi:osmotically-inducible protein OsmY